MQTVQNPQTVKLTIEGMSCGGCVRHVTQALGAIPGARVQDVKVGSATVAIDPQATSPQALVEAVNAAGYTAAASAGEG